MNRLALVFQFLAIVIVTIGLIAPSAHAQKWGKVTDEAWQRGTPAAARPATPPRQKAST